MILSKTVLKQHFHEKHFEERHTVKRTLIYISLFVYSEGCEHAHLTSQNYCGTHYH